LHEARARQQVVEAVVGDPPANAGSGVSGRWALERRARRDEPHAALAYGSEQSRRRGPRRRGGCLPIADDGLGHRGVGSAQDPHAATTHPLEHVEIGMGGMARRRAQRKGLQLPLDRACAARRRALCRMASLLGVLLDAQEDEPRAGRGDRREYQDRRHPAGMTPEGFAQAEPQVADLPTCSVQTTVSVIRFSLATFM